MPGRLGKFRFGRNPQAVSWQKKPAYGSLQIVLARRPRRWDARPTSFIRPPAVVTPAAGAFAARPIDTQLATRRRPPAVEWRLAPPQVLLPDAVPGDGKRRFRTALAPLVPAGLRRHAESRLGLPQVVQLDSVAGDGKRRFRAFLARPIPWGARQVHSRISPQVYAPDASGRLASTLVRRQRWQFKQISFLRPPATLTAAVAGFVARAVDTQLASRLRPPGTASRLGRPQVVNPDSVPGDGKRRFRAVLARPIPWGARQVRSRLSPPAVVAVPAAAPVDASLATHLARFRRQLHRSLSSKLSPPQVVAPLVGISPRLSLTLVRRPRWAQRPTSFIRPPAVVTAVAQAPVDANFATQLALFRRQLVRQVRSRLSPPQVVNPDYVPGDGKRSVRTLLARPIPWSARRARSQIFPPAVVSTAPQTPSTAGLATHLARGLSQLRHTGSRLAPPRVVNPDAVPGDGKRAFRATLARSIPWTARRGKSRLSPPAPYVVQPAPPVEALLHVHLAHGREQVLRLKPGSRLYPPKVVTPAPTRDQLTLRVKLARGREQILRLKPASKLQPPRVVTPFLPQPVVTRLAKIPVPGQRGLRVATYFYIVPGVQPVRPTQDQSTLRIKLARGREQVLRLRPTSRISPPTVVALFVPTTGFYDQPTPAGRSGLGTPTASVYDEDTPAGGLDRGTPDSNAFDRPTPGRVNV